MEFAASIDCENCAECTIFIAWDSLSRFFRGRKNILVAILEEIMIYQLRKHELERLRVPSQFFVDDASESRKIYI